MTNEEKRKLVIDEKAIILHYGFEMQAQKLKEELIELFDAANGYLDKSDTEAHFLEEMADVEVMIDQMKLHFEALDRVDEIKRAKVKRQLNRIGNEIKKNADEIRKSAKGKC